MASLVALCAGAAHGAPYTYTAVAEAINQQTPSTNSLAVIQGTPVINQSGEVAFGATVWCQPSNGTCPSIWSVKGGTATLRESSAYGAAQAINPFTATLDDKGDVGFEIADSSQGGDPAAAFLLHGHKTTQLSPYMLPNYAASVAMMSTGAMLVFLSPTSVGLAQNDAVTPVGGRLVNLCDCLAASPNGFWVYPGSQGGAKQGLQLTDVHNGRSVLAISGADCCIAAVNDSKVIAYWTHSFDQNMNELYNLYSVQVGSGKPPGLVASVNNGLCYDNGQTPVNCTESAFGTVALNASGTIVVAVTQTVFGVPGAQPYNQTFAAINGDLLNGAVFPPGLSVGGCVYPGNGAEIGTQAINASGQIVAVLPCGGTANGQPNAAVVVAAPQ